MKSKQFKEGIILLIEWLDVLQISDWCSRETVNKVKPAKIKQIGFFRKSNREFLTIISTFTDGDESDYTVIPWSIIKKIDEIGSIL